MRSLMRQSVTFLAIYTIALHAVLWGLIAQPNATNTFDPSTVICHSDASTPSQQTPDRGPHAPGHACDQCSLCNAAVSAATPNTILIARFEPIRILQVLTASIAGRDGVTTDPKLARGPPAFA
jgi:hypothetical protein